MSSILKTWQKARVAFLFLFSICNMSVSWWKWNTFCQHVDILPWPQNVFYGEGVCRDVILSFTYLPITHICFIDPSEENAFVCVLVYHNKNILWWFVACLSALQSQENNCAAFSSLSWPAVSWNISFIFIIESGSWVALWLSVHWHAVDQCLIPCLLECVKPIYGVSCLNTVWKLQGCKLTHSLTHKSDEA